VVEVGETIEQARKRAWETVEDSIVNMTLQMRDPGRTKLIWEEIK